MSDFSAYLEAAEQTTTFVALLTGIKKQFMEQGWDERMAEQATLLMLSQSGKEHR